MGNVFNMVGGGAGVKVELDTPTLTISGTTATAIGGFKDILVKNTYLYEYVSGGTITYNFYFDGTLKQSSTSNTYDFSGETMVGGTTYTIGVNVSATGIGTTETITATYKAPSYMTVAGLGSESPSSVTFTSSGTINFNFEEVTKLNPITGVNDVFIKIPKFYRKVVSVSSNQITSYVLADGKIDNDYKPYPCFVKEDGVTEMDYILIGKYRYSSNTVANSVDATYVSQTITNGRTNARALGSGYQLYDWQIHKLFQDLVCCYLRTINTNDGTGFSSMFGIEQMTGTWWVDGIASPSSGNNWVFSYKPSNYADQPSSSTTGYQAVNYSRPTASGNITKLGYDTNHPFINYTNAVGGDTYTTYYCDRYYYGSGSRPVRCYVGDAYAYSGVFFCRTYAAWTDPSGVRLCYRPL